VAHEEEQLMAKAKTKAKAKAKPSQDKRTPTQKCYDAVYDFAELIDEFLDEDRHFAPGEREELLLAQRVLAFLAGAPVDHPDAFKCHPKLRELAKRIP
jgi:hypothetical protein